MSIIMGGFAKFPLKQSTLQLSFQDTEIIQQSREILIEADAPIEAIDAFCYCLEVLKDNGFTLSQEKLS